MKNIVNKSISLVVLTMTLTGSHSAIAADLNKILDGGTCRPGDLETEPMQQRPYLVDDTWAKALATPESKALFDARKLQALKASANSIRDVLTSAHIIQELIRKFESLRSQSIDAIGAGELEPVHEGETYSRIELLRRQRSQDEFRQQKVLPILQQSFDFYQTTYIQREQAKKLPPDEAATTNLLAAVEGQRAYLNARIAQTLPTLAAKIGTIPSGSRTSLPFSYRDGRIVKIHFALPIPPGGWKEGQMTSVILYPRMLLNQFLGRDSFFVDTMKTFRDFTVSQYEAALEDVNSIRGIIRQWPVVRKFSDALVNAEKLRVRRELVKLVEDDTAGSIQVHEIIARLSDREILSMLDLFRELQSGNVPSCHASIGSMNEKMAKLLAGKPSSAAFSADKKKEIDALAKDIVFFQDMYGTFSEASAIVLAKTKGKNSL